MVDLEGFWKSVPHTDLCGIIQSFSTGPLGIVSAESLKLNIHVKHI